MSITIFNTNNEPKWFINLTQEGTQWQISDDSKYSLFNNPLAVGNSAGECLNNFLQIEQQLINGL